MHSRMIWSNVRRRSGVASAQNPVTFCDSRCSGPTRPVPPFCPVASSMLKLANAVPIRLFCGVANPGRGTGRPLSPDGSAVSAEAARSRELGEGEPEAVAGRLVQQQAPESVDSWSDGLVGGHGAERPTRIWLPLPSRTGSRSSRPEASPTCGLHRPMPCRCGAGSAQGRPPTGTGRPPRSARGRSAPRCAPPAFPRKSTAPRAPSHTPAPAPGSRPASADRCTQTRASCCSIGGRRYDVAPDGGRGARNAWVVRWQAGAAFTPCDVSGALGLCRL